MFTKSTSSLKYVNYQHWRTKLYTDGTSISSYTKWRLPVKTAYWNVGSDRTFS